jgi:hypothetical protein
MCGQTTVKKISAWGRAECQDARNESFGPFSFSYFYSFVLIRSLFFTHSIWKGDISDRRAATVNGRAQEVTREN